MPQRLRRVENPRLDPKGTYLVKLDDASVNMWTKEQAQRTDMREVRGDEAIRILRHEIDPRPMGDQTLRLRTAPQQRYMDENAVAELHEDIAKETSEIIPQVFAPPAPAPKKVEEMVAAAVNAKLEEFMAQIKAMLTAQATPAPQTTVASAAKVIAAPEPVTETVAEPVAEVVEDDGPMSPAIEVDEQGFVIPKLLSMKEIAKLTQLQIQMHLKEYYNFPMNRKKHSKPAMVAKVWEMQEIYKAAKNPAPPPAVPEEA